MWANAQRDDRPAEYKWRPLFNSAKFGWRPLLECREVTLPRRETRWNLQGCPKLVNRSQPLVGRSSPYYQDMWRRYCCLTVFATVNRCLSCEDIAGQSCAMVPRCRFFGDVYVLYFINGVQHISDMHSKFAVRSHRVWKYMVDIQSATAEIRRGKKERRKKKKPQDENITYGLPYYIGRPYNQDDVYDAVIMTNHCESSPGSFNEFRLSARWPPTRRPSQPTWAVSAPARCYHPYPPSPSIITRPKSW